jgi:signal peptidase I
MENTLLVGDRVVVEKLSSVKRGQVVVFGDPGGWLTGAPVNQRGSVGKALEFIGVLPDTGTEHLIKRVVGMPGDHVVCCDVKGRITVNGQPLDETSYLFKGSDGTQVKPSEIRFDVIVPAHRIFVMGDHRDDSRDSRCHLKDVTAGAAKGDNAFVPEDQVVGQAIVVVWPINRAKRLAIPATYESVPSGKTPAPSQPTIVAGPEANC